MNTGTREIELQENIIAQERLIERRLVMEEVAIKKPYVGTSFSQQEPEHMRGRMFLVFKVFIDALKNANRCVEQQGAVTRF